MHEPQGIDCRTNGMPPISRVLRDVLDRAEGDSITLATIVDSLGERTMAILMILFCLPNCLPVPPGVGLVFGFPMLLVATQMILAYQRPWLPRKLLSRSIKTDAYARMIDLAEPRLQRVESYLKPRYTFLFSGIAERLLGIFFALCAISVILPLPGSNFPPAIASVLGVARHAGGGRHRPSRRADARHPRPDLHHGGRRRLDLGGDLRGAGAARAVGPAPEQFQEKCAAVFRPELRRNKELERLTDSRKR